MPSTISDELIYLVFTTEVDINNAYKIGDLLLKEKLIPCINFKEIESHYWWEGKINRSKEIQIKIKCNGANLKKVCEKISESHSYELPEIIYFSVSTNKKFFNWVNSIDY